MTRTFTIEKGTETYGGTDTGSDGGKERNAGAVKIFLNASSKQDDVSKELRAFLDYVAGVESEDGFVQRVAEAVREAKKNREWRHEYMTLLMRDQENIEKGIEKGKSVGEEMMLMLIQKLVDNNRFDDISKIKDNKEYRQKLYEEYHISY